MSSAASALAPGALLAAHAAVPFVAAGTKHHGLPGRPRDPAVWRPV